MAGAPTGNTNASKGRKWQKAVERALARDANSNVTNGLDKAADIFVKAVMAGDQWALKELGDRIDGRPAQSLTVAGDEDNPLNVSGLAAVYGIPIASSSEDDSGESS